jgi:hypothetical protein
MEMRRKETKVDLVVYFSASFKEPTKEKHDRKFESPQYSVPILDRPGSDKFGIEFAYFGFFSVTGCTFAMEAQFQEPIYKVVGNQKKADKITEDADENEFEVIKEYQKYREKLETNKSDVFIVQNRNLDDFKINQQIRREDLTRIH